MRALNLYLYPNTRTRDLTAETCDLRMKSRVSGLPLRDELFRVAGGSQLPFPTANR